MKRLAIALILAASPLFAFGDATERVNAIRTAQGLSAIKVSRKLEKAAQAHATDMIKRGFYSHTGANGSSPGKRARRAGYRWCIVAENIAKGQKSLAQVMEDWRKSPSHHKNMTNRQMREYGLANAGDVWVMVLAARRC